MADRLSGFESHPIRDPRRSAGSIALRPQTIERISAPSSVSPAGKVSSTDVRLKLMADERCDLLCLDAPRAEEVRAALPSQEIVEPAGRRAHALADPTRLSVAAALAAGDELCGCDLAFLLGRAENLVSHHLRVLREAGLVEPRREGKTVMCSLTEDGRALLGAVLGEEVRA
jgi:ArsR family transcriptional regulator, lead/cadmium/zinc/bismuth-responsive transcriptional repressor